MNNNPPLPISFAAAAIGALALTVNAAHIIKFGLDKINGSNVVFDLIFLAFASYLFWAKQKEEQQAQYLAKLEQTFN